MGLTQGPATARGWSRLTGRKADSFRGPHAIGHRPGTPQSFLALSEGGGVPRSSLGSPLFPRNFQESWAKLGAREDRGSAPFEVEGQTVGLAAPRKVASAPPTPTGLPQKRLQAGRGGLRLSVRHFGKLRQELPQIQTYLAN